MADLLHEIEGVISDIQAGQVDGVDVMTLRLAQSEIKNMEQCLRDAIEMLAGDDPGSYQWRGKHRALLDRIAPQGAAVTSESSPDRLERA